VIAGRTDAAQIDEGLERTLPRSRSGRKSLVAPFERRQLLGPTGNFYQGIAWCDDLPAQTGLPDPLRHRVEIYVEQLRAADLATATAAVQE
jgi:hypothetical protein